MPRHIFPLLLALALAGAPALADTPARSSGGMKLTGKVMHGNGSADLIIEPRYSGHNGLPGTGFCGPWNGGNQKLWFHVTNIGSAPAPASQTHVGFGGALSATIMVPALQPGQTVLRSVAIPLAAWGDSQMHGVVNFLIAADHSDAVAEASVTNNYGQGSCVGPAG